MGYEAHRDLAAVDAAVCVANWLPQRLDAFGLRCPFLRPAFQADLAGDGLAARPGQIVQLARGSFGFRLWSSKWGSIVIDTDIEPARALLDDQIGHHPVDQECMRRKHRNVDILVKPF